MQLTGFEQTVIDHAHDVLGASIIEGSDPTSYARRNATLEVALSNVINLIRHKPGQSDGILGEQIVQLLHDGYEMTAQRRQDGIHEVRLTRPLTAPRTGTGETFATALLAAIE